MHELINSLLKISGHLEALNDAIQKPMLNKDFIRDLIFRDLIEINKALKKLEE